MTKKLAISAALLFASLPWQANAAIFSFSFTGGGVSGNVDLTYGAATDAKYPNAFEVTGISGFFSDSNNGLNIVNTPILGLQPITRDTPEAGNLLAPNDFSRFAVASGLNPVSNGFLTFDNLLWPGGSPATATDYPASGGFFDIYGLMFTISGGRVVNLWSNGTFVPGVVPFYYGVAVATKDIALDYTTVTPEPGTIGLLGTGLVGIFAWRRRQNARKLVA